MSDSLPIVLPARWGWRQRSKNTLIFHGLRFLVALLRAVPRRAIGPLAACLGNIAWVAAFKERRRAQAHVAKALPELTAAQQRTLVRNTFIHLAQSVLEMGHLPALLRETKFSDAQRGLIDAALAEGNGVLAVGGHIGNWELLAQVLAASGYPLSTIAKPLYDPRLTHWVAQERAAHGLRVIWRGQPGAARDMLRVFRNNQVLALLIDQDTRVESTFVPFFGRPAATPTAAATLALRTGAPTLVFWVHRDAFGVHHLHVERVEKRLQAGAPGAVEDLTGRLTARLEHGIRMHPAQWVWMHARWKRQPLES